MGERMTFGTPNQQHPQDICRCGDYRRSHRGGIGPCGLNSLGHGVPGYRCTEFRLLKYAEVEIPPKQSDQQ